MSGTIALLYEHLLRPNLVSGLSPARFTKDLDLHRQPR